MEKRESLPPEIRAMTFRPGILLEAVFRRRGFGMLGRLAVMWARKSAR